MHDIIIIGADPWDYYTWRRRHYVAWNLAANNRVLFIEPPLSVIQPFRDIDLSWRHLLRLGKLKHQGRKLFTFAPLRKYPMSLPFSNIFNYSEISRKSIFKKVKKIADKLNFKNPILWIYFHNGQYDYYGLFNEKIIITDWYDRFTASTGSNLSEETINTIKSKENKIISNADIIFTASQELSKDIEDRHNNIYMIPHGVDIDTFNNQSFSKDIQSYKTKIKKPVLCYLGVLHHKVDFNLLIEICRKKPEWSLMLIGKEWLHEGSEDKKLFNTLINNKNVYFTGEVTRKKIPEYLSLADVCLMPLKKNKFNECATAPLKMMQYFAAGKPVIAVDQGVPFDWDEYIYKASDYQSFIKAAENAIEDSRKETVKNSLKTIASKNSWKNKVNEMMSVIEQHLNNDEIKNNKISARI